jgi:hypothetical protein
MNALLPSLLLAGWLPNSRADSLVPQPPEDADGLLHVGRIHVDQLQACNRGSTQTAGQVRTLLVAPPHTAYSHSPPTGTPLATV